MFKQFKIFSLLLFLIPSLCMGDEGLNIVAVGEASQEKGKILVDGPYLDEGLSGGQKAMGKELSELIRNDFAFYKKYFKVTDRSSGENSFSNINKPALKEQDIRYLLRLEVGEAAENSIEIKFEAYDLGKDAILVEKNETIAKSELRTRGHEITDEVYRRITGKEKSIFTTHIYFVSDRTSRGQKTEKELYRMDFDGRDPEQLTNHDSIVISPSVSHDQEKILYSLVEKRKGEERNINLRIMDIETQNSTLLSSRDGINSGAVFTQNDQNILLTLSHTGKANIYNMDLSNKNIRQLTTSYSPDVDPSINRDGDLMAFLSGRSGSAMIYTMDPRERENNDDNEPERISFVGKYNATPRFSPDGSEIAFSSWMDNSFDIFRINSDRSGLTRLTKDFGSNEDPTYSNDGEFIAFSNQRVLSETKAVHNIYIMTREGEILGQVTHDYGNCITPRWSK